MIFIEELIKNRKLTREFQCTKPMENSKIVCVTITQASAVAELRDGVNIIALDIPALQTHKWTWNNAPYLVEWLEFIEHQHYFKYGAAKLEINLSGDWQLK